MELGVSRIQKPEHQAAGWAWLKQFTQANCYFLPLDEKKALVTIVLRRVSYGGSGPTRRLGMKARCIPTSELGNVCPITPLA